MSDTSYFDAQWHEARMERIYDQQRLDLITSLGLKLERDGNQFCYLYGENLQEGIAGFGDTPYLAMRDFYNRFMNEKIKIFPKSESTS